MASLDSISDKNETTLERSGESGSDKSVESILMIDSLKR